MTLHKIIHAASKALAVVGASLMMVIMVMTTFDVVARGLGARPIHGTSEIAEVMLVGAAFLTLPYAQQVGGHVATSLVVDRMPSRWARRLECVGMLLVLLILVWFSYEAVLRAIESVATGESRFGVREVPIWPGRVALAVGVVALALEVALHCVELARNNVVDGGDEASDEASLPENAYL